MTSKRDRVNPERIARPSRLLAPLLGGVLRSAPVWIPLALLVQVTTLGWLPARAESERLEREQVEVRARYDETRARFEAMSAELEASSDPVYAARLREMLEARRADRQATSPTPPTGR